MAATVAVRAPSAFATERALHTILGARRVNARREFFRASFVEARSLFALLVDAGESPADETSAGSSPVRVRAGPSLREGGAPWQSQLLQETCLRAWVESKYIHVPLREKDTGSKLEALYAMYASCVPPVHSKALGRNTFGKMLNSIYRGVGPHRGAAGETGIYLLR